MLRFAASASFRTAQFGFQTYVHTGRRIIEAVAPEPALGLARQVERAARESPAISGITRRLEEVAASNDFLNAATNTLRELHLRAHDAARTGQPAHAEGERSRPDPSLPRRLERRAGASGLRADPERARARRGTRPHAAPARRAAAQRRRPHRRAHRRPQLAADRAGPHDDRPPGRPAPHRPGPRLPQQPVPPRTRLVLARDPARRPPVPGRRGTARRARGHALRALRQGRPAVHPPDTVRRGLLQGLPGARRGRRRQSAEACPAGGRRRRGDGARSWPTPDDHSPLDGDSLAVLYSTHDE